MPSSIVVEGPDGQEFEFPDNTSPDVIKGAMAKHYGAPTQAPKATQASRPGYLQDMANIAPSALAKGLAATVGLPGDIASMLPKDPNDPNPLIPYPSDVLPTSEAINKKLASAMGGYKEAQTTPGQFADSALQFLPSAVTGPGGVAKRVGEALAMGVGSEAGGQLTKGTPFEVPARIAGAVLAGNPKAVAENSKALVDNTRAAATKVSKETLGAVKKQASDLFNGIKEAGVHFKPESVSTLADGLMIDLKEAGISRALDPGSSAVMRELRKLAKGDVPVSFTDLESARRMAINVLSSPNKSDRQFAGKIIGNIDSFVERVGSKDIDYSLKSVDPTKLKSTIDTARQLWKKSAKVEDIEKAVSKASNTIEGALNFDDNLRREFLKIVNSDTRMARYTPKEREIVTKIAKGEPIQNIQRLVGKLSPNNPLSLFASIGTGSVTGAPLIGVGMAAAGIGGKIASTLTTDKNAEKLKRVVLGIEKKKIPYKPVADRRAIIAAQIARQQPQTGDQ
jgi:hypothetical protein